MAMADGHHICLKVSQRQPQVRAEGIGHQGDVPAPDAKAGVSQPCNVHGLGTAPALDLVCQRPSYGQAQRSKVELDEVPQDEWVEAAHQGLLEGALASDEVCQGLAHRMHPAAADEVCE